jgi:hypothetical protein
MAVTDDSPEKHRVGIIAECHGAADQVWSSAAVAAAGVFQTDRRRAAPYRPPPHACLPGSTRRAQWSSGLERMLGSALACVTLWRSET